MLKLTKKGDKYWLFEDSEIGLFSPSKFTINLELNEIVIVYENGLKSKRYNVIDCEIYDLGELTPFTTSSGDLFMQKLEELNCPCFQKNENIYNITGGAWGSITGTLSDQTDLQSALDSKQDTLNAINLGQIIFNELAIKSTPSADDEIVMYDSLTGEAVTAKFSSFGGKRTMYLYFPIFQNVAASTSWYALPSTGQIFTGTGYTANAALTDANDFADLSYLTSRLFVPFQHKVKSVSIHGSTNTTTANPVQFAVVTSYVSTANSGALTIPNPLIVAQEGVIIYVGGGTNGFQKKFDDVNLNTSTLNAGTDYRIVFKNQNEASNIQRAMLIVEVEEVL